MKIVFDKDIPFIAEVLNSLGDTVAKPGGEITKADVVDADALLVRTRTRCDVGLLEGSRVKFIGTATIGFDHIDMEYCASHGISVATAFGSNARGVLQWVSAALAWLASDRGLEPCRTTLGVVGVGNVGSLVKEYASGWGFRVMCSDPPRERAEGLTAKDGFYPLGEIVAACDAVSFHVPLVMHGPDATAGLVGWDFFAAARPDALILNSSRGAVIEPEMLKAADNAGRFIIDTWNSEPDTDKSVLERVPIGTPHIAGYTVQGKATATAMIVNALAREFGLPLADWFPEGMPRSSARNISWEEMCASMPEYFDIAAESAALKATPDRFEQMRNNYVYRSEFF